jgi:hypothetical protein
MIGAYNGSSNRCTAQVLESIAMKIAGAQVGAQLTAQYPFFEVLTAEELAERWRVPPSWVREQCRSRCADPIPHARLGRYVRFSWGSPDLIQWWARRECINKKFICI